MAGGIQIGADGVVIGTDGVVVTDGTEPASEECCCDEGVPCEECDGDTPEYYDLVISGLPSCVGTATSGHFNMTGVDGSYRVTQLTEGSANPCDYRFQSSSNFITFYDDLDDCVDLPSALTGLLIILNLFTRTLLVQNTGGITIQAAFTATIPGGATIDCYDIPPLSNEAAVPGDGTPGDPHAPIVGSVVFST